MLDDELNELFVTAKLSRPYVYTNISTSSIAPSPRESCCCLLSGRSHSLVGQTLATLTYEQGESGQMPIQHLCLTC